MIVTITGFPGSGKSTLGKGIAKALGLRHYSAGELLRGIAKKKGLALLELHKLMEKDRSIDDDLDNINKRLGKTEDGFVIDGRLSWHFIPNSAKIFVKVDLKKAAERVFRDTCKGNKERCGEVHGSVKETVRNMQKRMEMNQKRYRKLYGVNYLDESNYDIVVDTTNASIPETRKRVLKEIKKLQGAKRV